jgi:hypothetical protein
MLSAHRHPEFGYLCPSSTLRRVFQGALAFVVLGTIAGAGSVGALIADHDADGTITAVPVGSTEATSEVVVPASTSTGRSAPADPKTAAVGAESAKAGSDGRPGPDRGLPVQGPMPAKTEATRSQCESTWAYLDGKCEAGKIRKVRLARKEVPAASPEGGNRSAGATNRASRPSAGAPDVRQSVKPAAPPSGAPVAQDGGQQTVAARKPQRTTDAYHRQRDPSAGNRQMVRVARADPRRTTGSDLGQGPFAGLFGIFR